MSPTEIDQALDNPAPPLQGFRKKKVQPLPGPVSRDMQAVDTRRKNALFHDSQNRIEKFRDAA
jgi:hypothetical protein